MKTLVAAASLITAVVASANAEPVQLKYAYPGSPAALVYTHGLVPWAEEVNKASEGTIEIKLFPGTALATPQNILDRLINGVVEIGHVYPGFYADQFPRSMVAMLPFESRTPYEAAYGNWRLYQKGLFGEEFAKLMPMALPVFTNMSVHSRKLVRTMADMKGLKVASLSRTMSEVIEKLGGTPITMPPVEFYSSLQRGTVDGVGLGWPAMPGYKLNEVTSYHVDSSLTGEGTHQLMSRDAYNKLPAPGKAAIDRLSGMHYSKMYADAIAAMNQQGIDLVKATPNQVIVTLAPEEEARWQAQARAVVDQWAAKTPNGVAVLAAFRAEVANIRAGN